MMHVPVLIPVTTPAELIVPIAGLDELQVPPVIDDESVVAEPVHTAKDPVIGGGTDDTVTTAYTVHPPAV